jgi:hypothetical protein
MNNNNDNNNNDSWEFKIRLDNNARIGIFVTTQSPPFFVVRNIPLATPTYR